MDCPAFVPKVQEFDLDGNFSDTTKDNSDDGAFDSDAFREFNNYCEATRKKQKKQFNKTVEMKRKTEMCKNIIHFGECKFGNNCSYAHTKDELLKKKHVQSNYMTKLCTQFHDHEV